MGSHSTAPHSGTDLGHLVLRALLCVALLGFASVATADSGPTEPPSIVHDVELPERATRSITVVGIAQSPDGAPITDAVIVSAAGGKAVSNASGAFELTVRIPDDARAVGVTAVASIRGVNLVGGRQVSIADVDRHGRTNLGAVILHANGDCEPDWVPTFGGEPGTDGLVHAVAAFDDGSGPALYAGGSFLAAGGVAMGRIGKWDGASWSPVGGGMNNDVRALTVFDDGGGPALYAGGLFSVAGGVEASRIAKWDGNAWSPLGSGVSSAVYALAGFDDGDGPALYAGGTFLFVGQVAANRIAKWDGAAWSPLGSGVDGVVSSVRALAVFDGGDGPALHVGGEFTSVGGVTVNGIAKWDGTTWLPLGIGMDGDVLALRLFDDGSGAALYAGGTFGTAGGIAANRIARWDGSAWSPLGSGTSGAVIALTVFDDGNGPALYAGGGFTTAGGVTVNRIAKWDGTAWSSLGSGTTGSVRSLTVLDDGNGGSPTLYAGGSFGSAGGISANGIAGWDGASWAPLNGAGKNGVNDPVHALAAFKDDGWIGARDGGGPALYAGGTFTITGGVTVNRIAKWDGTSWSSLGSGIETVNGAVFALTAFDDGNGPALYAGGAFSDAGGVEVSGIAKWDGTAWSPLGSGVGGMVHALTVFDDGGGPALYAAGAFITAGGVTVNHVARWDGTAWSPLGSGTGNWMYALVVYDDGGGPALYAGGTLFSAGGVAANGIAKWDGTSWAPLEGGVSGAFQPNVRALTVFDDGNGDALYAGGNFTTAGGVAASRIAKWDGTSWAPLQSQFGNGVNNWVGSLTVFDDGSGPALYAGGGFTTAGGATVNRIAKWDGASWSSLAGRLGRGVPDWVGALTVFDDGLGGGPGLFAGGLFFSSPAGDSYLAKWHGCLTDSGGVLGDLNGDDIVDGADLGILLSAWGPCADPNDCPADLNGDGTVDGADLGILLSAWSN